MNRLLFRQRLNHLREVQLRISGYALMPMKQQMQSDTRKILKSLVWICQQAESIAVRHKNIVSIFQMNGREQVQSCAAEAQGITVKEQPYGYEVILPHLMPKRKSSESYRISPGAANLRLKGIYCGASNLPFGVCSDLVYL